MKLFMVLTNRSIDIKLFTLIIIILKSSRYYNDFNVNYLIYKGMMCQKSNTTNG
jgi:hypothetical protein